MAKRAKVLRTVRLERPADADGVRVFGIYAEGTPTFYAAVEIPCEIGGRGFAVQQLDLESFYHVRIGVPEQCSCECMCFLRWSKCKHVSALLALERLGKT